MPWLVSSAFQPEQRYCMQFFYRNIVNKNNLDLDRDSSLTVKRQFANGTSTNLWKMSAKAMKNIGSNRWNFALVPIDAMEQSTLVT